MAITKTWPDLRPSSTGARPIAIFPGEIYADLGQVSAVPLDETSMILVPTDGWSFNEQGEYDEEDYDAPRTYLEMSRCWAATIAYERIGDIQHPNLLPFLRRDPWTAFPILATPLGKPLCKIIEEHKDMYSAPLDTPSTRVLPEQRHLIYKWALDLISALSFIHSEDIVFGTLQQDNCWIATEQTESIPQDSSLSVYGFVDAAFKNKPEEESIDAREQRGFVRWSPGRHGYWYMYPGEWEYSPYYYWNVRNKRNIRPTRQTDLYLYGCVLYELMVGISSSTPYAIRSEVARKIKAAEWPMLETEYMGDIVLKCWKEEFASAEEVKVEVERFIQMHQESSQ